MTRNIGTTDRVVRLVIGLGILSLAFVGPKSAWGYLGLVPIVIAIVGWCPPYALFGISTCRRTAQAADTTARPVTPRGA